MTTPSRHAAMRRIIARSGFWRGYKVVKATIGDGFFWEYVGLWIEELV